MTAYDHHDPDVSAGTIRAYEFCWRRYVGWCSAEGRDPWTDPDGKLFAEFVVAEVRAGRKPNTISQSRAAITYRYRTDPALYGLADPAKSEAVVSEMKRLSRRTRGQRVAKAPAMTPDILERVVAVSAIRRSRESAQRAVERHLEFACTVRLMFDSALRCDDMMRAEWGHLSAEANGGGFRSVYVPPGKTAHDRHGNVSPPTWAALQRWRTLCPTPAGRISTAASARALGERIRRGGAFAGIEISGHSPRRGVLTAAARGGATMSELMAVAGHKSPSMVSEYVDAPDAADNAVARLYAAPEPEPEPPAAVGLGTSDVVDLMFWSAHEFGLNLAVKLGADRDHPAIVAVHKVVFDRWPKGVEGLSQPRHCARPGCPGLVGLRVGSTGGRERWCSDRCRV